MLTSRQRGLLLHLKGLNATGLIQGETKGNGVHYCTDEVVWQQAKDLLLNLLLAKTPTPNC